jgi:hypothetical protein
VPVLTRRRIGGLALAATLVLGGGLAAAATLRPQAGEEGWVGATQAGQPPEQAAHGQAVAAVAQDETLTGCEKGQAVAAVASSKAGEHRQDQAEKPNPCDGGDGEAEGSGGRGDEASAFGREIAERARADGRSFGEEMAARAQEDGRTLGEDTAAQASGGASGGSDASAGSADAGAGAADGGLATAGSASGGAAEAGGPPEDLTPGPPGAPGPPTP